MKKLLCILFSGLMQFSWASEYDIDVDASYEVKGLVKPAEIIVDKWGVPHIYAQTHYDAFYVQGFNAARDRLWQIDLWRKRGLGQLSESFGSEYLEQDKAARLFLYRKDMYSEWLAYGNDAKQIAVSFAAGINAYVDLTEANPQLLPPEFKLLGYKPSRWVPDDVVRIRSNGLWRNINNEVWRAKLACAGLLDLAGRWKPLEPAWQTTVPLGLDPCVIPEDVLHLYTLAKAPVSFNSSTSGMVALSDQPHIAPALGSNNWVVAPERTTTGRPILADDPHRGHAVPSLRYIAHLEAPGINVIGAGEPALPGISIGHNERIAFGLTIFPIDQEDLYVYEKRDNGYAYGGDIEPFLLVDEIIAVSGADDETVSLKFTRHGPVIAETSSHAFAVRAAWLEPGMSPYFGSVEYMRAQNFREFIGALNRWGAPSENQVYADIDGNIGYKPAGRFPVRLNWDGLLPVPGNGTYEWDGYFDMDVLPEEYNPERGYTGTANSMNLPDDYPINKYRVGFEWSAPWRYKRMWEVLTADDRHSMQDSLDLQRDYHSVFTRNMLATLSDTNHLASHELLKDWDGNHEVDSPAAALWNVWYRRHLTPALGQSLSDGQLNVTNMSLDSMTVLEQLGTPEGQQIVSDTLADAWEETTALLGSNPKKWEWGALHQIKFLHPLHGLAKADLQNRMALAPYPRGGTGNTTNNTGFYGDNFDVQSGASFRMVVDVGNWDAALATNAPGQSGDPRSRFYGNLLENWATEKHFPLLFSRKAVNENAVFKITLLPQE